MIAPMARRTVVMSNEMRDGIDDSLQIATPRRVVLKGAGGLALLRADGPKTLKTENGWSQMVGAAEFGTDYLFRAYVALTAFGANLNADTVYPIALTDSAGETSPARISTWPTSPLTRR